MILFIVTLSSLEDTSYLSTRSAMVKKEVSSLDPHMQLVSDNKNEFDAPTQSDGRTPAVPGKSNANDESDSDMPEIDSEFGDRYAGAESEELDIFSRLYIWGKLKNMCEKRTGK